ncbi:MAG: protein kinase family protein, partial [Candidatus Xenobia bacterium]
VISEDRSLHYIEQVGEALEVLHQASILHRDIKPENILVEASGRAILIDFGTAKEFTAGKTKKMTACLTPGYAPLEQYTEKAVRGPYTDVYALAGTLYHMLTGIRPLPATDRAVGREITPVNQLNTLISNTVSNAIVAGMAMEITRRPQTVRDFLVALRKDGVTAPPPDIAAPAPKVIPVPTQKEPLLRLRGHDALVRAVAFSPDSRLLASGGWDGTLRLWDLRKGNECRIFKRDGQPAWIWSIAFSPNGKMVAAADDRSALVFEVDSGKVISTMPHPVRCLSVSFSHDGRQVATGAADARVRVWDVASSKEVHRLTGHRGQVSSVVYSPDGFLLASAAEDRSIRLWEASSGRELQLVGAPADKVAALALSGDGRLMAAAAGQYLCISENYKDTHRLPQEVPLCALAFSAEGSVLASGGEDFHLRLWDAAGGQSLGNLERHGGKVTAVAFSPDGSMLASGAGDKLVRMWKLNTAAAPAPLGAASAEAR